MTRGDGGDGARRFARKRPYVLFRIMSKHFYRVQRRRGDVLIAPAGFPDYVVMLLFLTMA